MTVVLFFCRVIKKTCPRLFFRFLFICRFYPMSFKRAAPVYFCYHNYVRRNSVPLSPSPFALPSRSPFISLPQSENNRRGACAGTERPPSPRTSTLGAPARSRPGSSWSRTGWTPPCTSSAPSASGGRLSTTTFSRRRTSRTSAPHPRRKRPSPALPSRRLSRTSEVRSVSDYTGLTLPSNIQRNLKIT